MRTQWVKRLRRAWVREVLSKRMRAALMCTGSIQKASMRLMASATETTKGMTNMKSPTSPGSSISGRKAAMVVSTEEVTGLNTSRRESSAASSAWAPRCKR